MQKSSHRRDAFTEHARTPLKLNHLSWDDVRIFLACVDSASFRKASETLRMSSSTVVRRIERLETALSVRLFHRVPEGVVLTAEAESIVASARRMEDAVFDVLRRRSQPDKAHRGVVKISITEGLGSYWVMPRLVEFQREHPFMIVNLRCAMESADVLRMEADLAVQFEKPPNPELIAVKLGRLHIYPFVAQEYVDVYGMPNTIEEMADHRLVDQVAPQLDDGAWPRYLGLDNVEGIVGIRTNASSSLFYAVEKGAGIGALPTYACALKAPVIPVDVGIHHHLDIWLTFHPDARKIRRNALMIDWLKRIFDPAQFPWFRDEFIHPNELVDLAPPETKLNVVRGYFAAKPFDL